MSGTEERPTSLLMLLKQLDEQGITDHRRYQMVRNFLSFQARDKAIPISSSFELTPLCNLDCKMCYVHLHKNQMQGAELLSTEQWKELMKEAIDAGMMYARLTGGECLTYPGFKELLLFLREHGVETTILSNGILMNEEMVAFLKENPPAAVQITLYGASEEGYEKVTGHRMFEKVLHNIQLLKEAKIPLTIAITPNAFMEDGEEIIHLVNKLGIPYNINSGIVAPREETGRQVQDAEVDLYVRMMKLRRTYFGFIENPEVDPEELPDPGGAGSISEKGVICGAGRSSFALSWQGEMRPCNTFPGILEAPLKIGFIDAWQRIHKQVMEFPLPMECMGCRYKKGCKHCVAEHASGAPVGHANPAICAWAKRMAAEGLGNID